MKIKTLILFLLFISSISFGQKKVIKSRALILPENDTQFLNLGIGFEYPIDSALTLQIVLNHRRSTTKNSTHDLKLIYESILEMRYYLIKNQPRNNAFFGHAFLIGGYENLTLSEDSPNLYNDYKNDLRSFNLGGGIGKNIRINSRWHFEFLIGLGMEAGFNFYKTVTPTLSFENNSFTFGFKSRGAINLGYSF